MRKATPLMNTLAHKVAARPIASIDHRRAVPMELAVMAAIVARRSQHAE
jgi:hypothetical protein